MDKRTKNGNKIGLYQCSCANKTIKEISMTIVKCGESKSCGCLHQEISKKVCKENFTKHGKTKSVEFVSWSHMKARCYNINNKNYNRWGGRGIYVCDRWLESFENFLEDMGKKSKSNYSIERIDNDGPYCKENCIWTDSKTQCRNRSNNIMIEYNGEKLTLIEWSENLNINYKTLKDRIFKFKWSVDRAFTQPVRKKDKKL